MDSMDAPGPEYVRVLAVLERQDSQEWLVSLARNLWHNRTSDIRYW